MGYSYIGYDEIIKSVQIIKGNNYEPIYYTKKVYDFDKKTNEIFYELIDSPNTKRINNYDEKTKKLISEISSI